jgi:hypothetical protein
MSSEVTKVYMRPVWVKRHENSRYLYDIEHDGELVVKLSKSPLCDAARWCASNGKTGKVEVWRHGSSFPAMTGEISKYANLTVTEPDKGPPRFIKWQPFDPSIYERKS